MPYLDVARSNFKLIFSIDETDLERRAESLIISAGGERSMIHSEKKFPKNGLPYYTITISLRNAIILKKAFSNYNLSYSDKYKDITLKLYEDEEKFKLTRILTDKIKRTNPKDLLKHIDYKFKTKPWNHQIIGFCLLMDVGSFIINWDMRTGKTMTVACAMEKLVQLNPDEKTLIISPSNIVSSTWISDVYKHTELEGYAASQKLNKQRLQGLKRGKITMPLKKEGTYGEFSGNPSYVVLNHDSISNEKILDWILNTYKPDNFIIDEFHCFKSPTAKRSKQAMKVAKQIHEKNGRVILMSGTPIPKDVRDIFTPCQLCDHKILPFSKSYFDQRYCIIEGGYKDGVQGGFPKYIGEKNEEELKARLFPRSQRILIQEVHDMPEKIDTISYVEMSDEQKEHHRTLKKELYMELPKDGILTVTAMTKIIKLVQITGGYIYDTEKKVQLLKTNTKLIELENILNQILSNDKNNVVIFTNYRPSVRILSDFLEKSEWKYSELTTQTKNDRVKAVVDFQDRSKNNRIMLAQPVLCPGNDFSKANYAIFYDNTFKYVDRDQAETRIYTHTSIEHGTVITIDLMCKNSIDEFIYKNIQRKKKKNHDLTKEELLNFLGEV